MEFNSETPNAGRVFEKTFLSSHTTTQIPQLAFMFWSGFRRNYFHFSTKEIHGRQSGSWTDDLLSVF